MGFFDKLKKINIFASFGSELTDDFYDELEESLILADTGMDTTLELVEELRRRPGPVHQAFGGTVHRGERGGQDHHHRQDRGTAEEGAEKGAAVRRRHIQGRRRRAADHLGGPLRPGDHQAARGRGPGGCGL